MKKEISEDSKFEVSLKTLGGIGFLITTLVSMWFVLQADIAEAKQLPEPPPPDVTRMEFKNIRLTIQNTADDVEEIKEDLKRMEDKIDALK